SERLGHALRATLQRLADRSESVLGARVVVGIGSVVHSASDLDDSRAHADEVVRAICSDTRGGVADIAEMASRVLLLRMTDSLADHSDLLSGPIRALQQHDLQSNTCYLHTLSAYLDAFGAVDVAAQQLCVHGNTVRYRLRQIQSLTGLDLGDPDE